MTADEYFNSKETVPSEMRTAEWRMAGQWAKERAFYSAGVAEAEILDEFRLQAQAVVEGSTDESSARKNLQMFLDRLGYAPEAGQEGTIKDLRSVRRLTVMLRTNRQLAQGYAQKIRGFSPAAIRLFPAWELVRLGPDPIVPRDWQERWLKAGGGLTEDGRMIALKQDLIWAELGHLQLFPDALGVDYPPFAWQSGIGWREVSYADAKALGLLDGWKAPETQPLRSPNENLELAPKVASPALRKALAEKLKGLAEWDGDKLRFTDPNGTRELTHMEAAKVITAKLPNGFPNMQADAARFWFADATKNIKLKRGKDVLDDFTRMVQRIIPLKNGVPVYRGEYYASEMDLNNRLKGLIEGHAVKNMADSFTVSESVALRFARGKTPYELIVWCKTHTSLRPVFAIAKKVYPKYWRQGEVIALEGVKFRSVGNPVTMIDVKGRKQIYLEVEEVSL